MTHKPNLLDLAIQYHEAMPARIRAYLNVRGIADEVIDSHLLGWNGWRITVPIYNRQGEVTFFRLAKDPQDERPAPKMVSSPGSTVELYGWDEVLKHPQEIIICEGEFDRLVLAGRGFAAVTSTGGAATFRPQWAAELRQIDEVYICFDRDSTGKTGAQVVALMIQQAKLVELPSEVGEGGDVSDFFVRLERTQEDFIKLLASAKPTPVAEEERPARKESFQSTDSLLAKRIAVIKRQIPVESVIAQYLQLRPSGKHLVANCPFHDDRTPSFTVYPASGTYHCFGCRAHGDVIAFVAAMEKLSFGQALEVLETFTLTNEPRNTKDSRERKAA
jgi:DNA primase